MTTYHEMTKGEQARLTEIATRRFTTIHTMETQNSDGLDFHDCAIWQIREALADAYDAGKRAAQAEAE